MRRWDGRYVTRVAAPAKALLQRFGFVVLLAGAFTLLMVGRTQTVMVERLSTAVTDLMAPVMGALARPIESAQDMAEAVGRVFTVYEQNEALRQSNERLLRWETVARRLEQENAALRALLNYRPETLSA
ncbi:MAG: rod shape-determining protein MreC, partial [Alphaproteobacteria bacterium]|nr:rod shape-determining protein MreC [Alphaproteobacteria bacterium]